MSVLPCAAEPASPSAAPPLTAAQLAWAGGREVRVGSDPAFAPFSEVDAGGVLHGVDARLLDAISVHTGLRFRTVRFSSWAEAWEAFQRGEVDVLTGCAATPERAKVALFTEPYVRPRLAIVAHQESDHGWSIEDLAGLSVVIPSAYVLEEELRSRLPTVRLSSSGTLEQALAQVAERRADATLMNVASAVSLMPKAPFRDLRVTGFYDREFPLRLAVRKSEDHERHLLPVLESALASLRHQREGAAYASWVEERLDEWAGQARELRRQRLGLGFLAATTVLSAAGWAWSRRGRRRDRRVAVRPNPEPATVPGILESAFERTGIPMLVVQRPDLILERNAAARALLDGSLVLPPELAAVADRLSTQPQECPEAIEWAPPGQPPVRWQARLLPLPGGPCLLTLVP